MENVTLDGGETEGFAEETVSGSEVECVEGKHERAKKELGAIGGMVVEAAEVVAPLHSVGEL